jgi:hypothetical protein
MFCGRTWRRDQPIEQGETQAEENRNSNSEESVDKKISYQKSAPRQISTRHVRHGTKSRRAEFRLKTSIRWHRASHCVAGSRQSTSPIFQVTRQQASDSRDLA